MTFLVGFRIEFRTRLSTPDQSQLIGAVLAEESFVMTGIPSKGDYIDVSYIIGSGSAAVWWPGPLPFMTVHHLEHYAAPVGGDMDPGVQVVCYADPPGDYQAAHLVDYFKDAGWQLHVSVEDSSFGRAAKEMLMREAGGNPPEGA